MAQARIEYYKSGDWRWRLVAGNGEIVASGEGYKTKAGVLRGIVTVCKAMNRANKLARIEQSDE